MLDCRIKSLINKTANDLIKSSYKRECEVIDNLIAEIKNLTTPSIILISDKTWLRWRIIPGIQSVFLYEGLYDSFKQIARLDMNVFIRELYEQADAIIARTIYDSLQPEITDEQLMKILMV